MCKVRFTQKIISALALAVLMLLCNINNVKAQQPQTLYVNSTWTAESCGDHTWGVDAFNTIQNAVNAAVVSNGAVTINVAEGTYTGDVAMNGKSNLLYDNSTKIGRLHFIAEEGKTVTVNGQFTFGNDAVQQQTICDLEINGFTFTDVTYPLYLMNSGTASKDIVFKNNTISYTDPKKGSNYGSVYMCSASVDGATVTGNTITGATGYTMDFSGAGGMINDITISGNTFTNCGAIALFGQVQKDGVTISNNTFDNNSAAVYANDNKAANIGKVSFSGNTFVNNDNMVVIYFVNKTQKGDFVIDEDNLFKLSTDPAGYEGTEIVGWAETSAGKYLVNTSAASNKAVYYNTKLYWGNETAFTTIKAAYNAAPANGKLIINGIEVAKSAISFETLLLNGSWEGIKNLGEQIVISEGPHAGTYYYGINAFSNMDGAISNMNETTATISLLGNTTLGNATSMTVNNANGLLIEGNGFTIDRIATSKKSFDVYGVNKTDKTTPVTFDNVTFNMLAENNNNVFFSDADVKLTNGTVFNAYQFNPYGGGTIEVDATSKMNTVVGDSSKGKTITQSGFLSFNGATFDPTSISASAANTTAQLYAPSITMNGSSSIVYATSLKNANVTVYESVLHGTGTYPRTLTVDHSLLEIGRKNDGTWAIDPVTDGVGYMKFSTGDVVTIEDGSVVRTANYINNNGGSITIDGSAVNVGAGDLANSGTIILKGNNTITFSEGGTFANTGIVAFSGYTGTIESAVAQYSIATTGAGGYGLVDNSVATAENTNYSLMVDGTSTLTAGSITIGDGQSISLALNTAAPTVTVSGAVNVSGTGTITVDMTGATADSYTLITSGDNSNYGSNFIVKNGAYQLEQVGNNLVANKYTAAAKIGDIYYATLQDACDAVTNNQTIVLLKDATETTAVTTKASISFTIDMNGFNYTNTAGITNNSTKITLKDSSASETSLVFNANISGGNPVTFTTGNITIEGEVLSNTVLVTGSGANAKINGALTGSKSGTELAIKSGTTLTVEEDAVISGYVGLYFQYGTVNFKAGSTLLDYTTAYIAQAGAHTNFNGTSTKHVTVDSYKTMPTPVGTTYVYGTLTADYTDFRMGYFRVADHGVKLSTATISNSTIDLYADISVGKGYTPYGNAVMTLDNTEVTAGALNVGDIGFGSRAGYNMILKNGTTVNLVQTGQGAVGTVTIDAGNTLTFAGEGTAETSNSTITAASTFTNNGTIEFNNFIYDLTQETPWSAGTFTNNGGYALTEGAQITAGDLTNSLSVDNTSTLTAGSITIGNGQSISLALNTAAPTVTVSGAVNVSGTGAITVDMTGATEANYKLINANDASNYGTNINVTGMYVTKVIDNDLYATKAVASITAGETTTYYATLADAIDKATDNDVITMLANTSENDTIPAEKTVTIDINGKVISALDEAKNVITNNGNLTLTDGIGGGNITGGTTGVKQNGTLTLSGKVNITGNGTDDNRCNLYLPSSDKTFSISNPAEGMKVGITKYGDPSQGDITLTGANTADYSRYFFSDNPNYSVKNTVKGTESNVLVLTNGVLVTLTATEGGEVELYVNGVSAGTSAYVTLNNTVTIKAKASDEYAFKGWYDTKNPTKMVKGKSTDTYTVTESVVLEARFTDQVIWVRVKKGN